MCSESKILDIYGFFLLFLTYLRKHNTKARKITWNETALSKKIYFGQTLKKERKTKIKTVCEPVENL